MAKFKTYSQQDRTDNRRKKKSVGRKQAERRCSAETLEFKGKNVVQW